MLKLLGSFFTLWLLLFLYVYYRRKFEHQKATGAMLPQDTLASSGLLASTQAWSFAPEALLCLVHAPPFFCAEVSMQYYDLRRGDTFPTTLNTDELAAVFMMTGRSSLLLRSMPYVSGLWARRFFAYANLNHLNVTGWVSLRMAYTRHPGLLLGSVTLIMLVMLSFAMQVFERRVQHDLDHYANCFWLVLVSMSGIGFGDLYPQTTLGRAVSSAAFGWGALLAALTIMTTIRYAELSDGEKRVEHMIRHTRTRIALKQRAAFYIQAAWAAYLERLQRSQSSLASSSLLGAEPLHADPKFCRRMRAFRAARKEAYVPDDLPHLIFKEVLDTRSRVELRLRDLEEKLEEMDAKFEHNIGAMNELLQKNLKYLKHIA